MFGINALGLVDVVNPFTVPDAAIAIISFNRVDCFACVACFDAFRGNLPTALVCNDFTLFKGQTVVIGELANGENVNHGVWSLRSLCIYYNG
jgi:hypothetical protein